MKLVISTEEIMQAVQQWAESNAGRSLYNLSLTWDDCPREDGPRNIRVEADLNPPPAPQPTKRKP